jgi:type III secretion HrpO family protein
MMDSARILEYTVNAVYLTMMLSMAPILVATIVGLIVSLFQALTQIQEQTLGFAVKLIAVTITLLLTARWMGSELLTFCNHLFDVFPTGI